MKSLRITAFVLCLAAGGVGGSFSHAEPSTSAIVPTSPGSLPSMGEAVHIGLVHHPLIRRAAKPHKWLKRR